MARSRNIDGPYELHPDTYVLTARDRPDSELQRAGHADRLSKRKTARPTWSISAAGLSPTAVAAFWAARPRSRKWCGRPMAGSAPPTARDVPRISTPAPDAAAAPIPRPLRARRFRLAGAPASISSGSARHGPRNSSSLTERPGYPPPLRPRNPGQPVRARRWWRAASRHFCFTAATAHEFEPEHFQQMAGLICYYNATKFHYLYVTEDDTIGRHLRVMSCLPDRSVRRLHARPSPAARRAASNCASTSTTNDLFRLPPARTATGTGCPGRSTPASCRTRPRLPALPNFTGAFVGICCQDLAGTPAPRRLRLFRVPRSQLSG